MRFLSLLLLLCSCAASHNPLESAAILDRPEVAKVVSVQHVLIGWSWLESGYKRMGMGLDPRAQARNETAADELAGQLLAKCSAGTPFIELMRQYSEDPASSATGMVYTVDESSGFVAPFKELALHLKAGECGLVRSQFGWHVMKRLK